jgi:hypothetical protein
MSHKPGTLQKTEQPPELSQNGTTAPPPKEPVHELFHEVAVLPKSRLKSGSVAKVMAGGTVQDGTSLHIMVALLKKRSVVANLSPC